MKENRQKPALPGKKKQSSSQTQKKHPHIGGSGHSVASQQHTLEKQQNNAGKHLFLESAESFSFRCFSECLKHCAAKHQIPIDLSGHSIDPLAQLDYDLELMLKSAALAEFLKQTHIDCEISPIQAAPKPRRYRTTTKRRGKIINGKFCLSMGYDNTIGDDGLALSLLEPVEHETIYRFALQYFRKPAFTALANAVNYVIIRGNYRKFAVIINLKMANGIIIRKLKEFSVKLNAALPFVSSCYMYLDETGSDYYFEMTRPEAHKVAFKKLFGPEFLDVTVNGIKLLYPLTAFSQVNEAMLGPFIETVYKLLEPESGSTLYDLYCGYGLFSLIGAARSAGNVVGIDWEGQAIKSARANARHLYPTRNFHYFAGAITEDFLSEHLLATQADNELFLLDPPRGGTARGVIELIASRHPRKVLHIFCGTDEIPRELELWRNAGYRPVIIKPFDMFAGTANLETVCLLSKLNTK